MKNHFWRFYLFLGSFQLLEKRFVKMMKERFFFFF